jgi:hypothetical protein
MDIEEIKAAVRRKPFRPFSVNVVDGEQLHISQESEVLFPRSKPQLVIVFNPDGTMHLLEAEAVSSLITQ